MVCTSLQAFARPLGYQVISPSLHPRFQDSGSGQDPPELEMRWLLYHTNLTPSLYLKPGSVLSALCRDQASAAT